MRLILLIHILAGALALVLGYVALYAAKGAALHRKSGRLFVYAMFTMCIGGFVLALGHFNNWSAVNASAAMMTFYLVLTSLTTVKPLAFGGRTVHLGAMLVAFAIGAIDLMFGFKALANGGRRHGVPAFPFFMFGVVGLLGSAGDLRMIRASSALDGRLRLLRHLWRMSFALLVAAMSFFLGQAQVIPEPLRITPLLVAPVLAVLLTLVYWVWRIRARRGTAMRPGAQTSYSLRSTA
jgi:uncharacterized membrane protein